MLASWIDRFVESTAHVETPLVFRRWTAIATIAACLEQKVWITTSSPMFPNLYTGLIAQPGVGKTRIISEAGKLLNKLPEPHIAPTSINSSSLVDQLVESKRSFIGPDHEPIEYNSMALLVDELGTFMHEYDNALVAELTSFYDVTALPYGQRRRGNNMKLKIDKPQLNILFGSTPSNLMKFMPEGAWSQGFASRIIFVYSEEKNIVDDFAGASMQSTEELSHDLAIINSLVGKFSVTEDYRSLVNLWREAGETLPSAPRPTHPRLLHYNTRRKAHLYRLSMISAVDRGDLLLLAREDFNRAMGWLAEAEANMARIFKVAGNDESPTSVMDEVMHFMSGKGTVDEHRLVRFVAERAKSYEIKNILELMERANMIKAVKTDRMGVRIFAIGTQKDTGD